MAYNQTILGREMTHTIGAAWLYATAALTVAESMARAGLGRRGVITLYERVIHNSSFIRRCWAKVGTRGKLKIESLTKSFNPLHIAAFMDRSIAMAYGHAAPKELVGHLVTYTMAWL